MRQVVGIVAAVSWVLFSTDEIGHLIEEPFGTQSARAVRRQDPIPLKHLGRIFEALQPAPDGTIALSQVARLGAAVEEAGGIAPEKVARLIDIGERVARSGADLRLGFESFRLLWSFTATEVRDDRLETLPLNSMCATINRDLFTLSVAQRRAVDRGLVGAAVDLDGDAIRRLNLLAPLSSEPPEGVKGWTEEEVGSWLQQCGLARFANIFRDNDING
jgi:hypothetical protein